MAQDRDLFGNKVEDEIRPKTVDEYLNEVDYKEINNYVPSEFALSIINLIKLIEGGEPEHKSPVVHLRMLDNFVVKNRDVINLCHRGLSKTTLVEYLMWYIALFNNMPNLGVVPYALYVSDSIDNGIKRMRKSIENRYNRSEFLQKMVPKLNLTDTRWEFINVDNTKFVVSGHGAKSGVRGTRENGSRPVLALLDDLLSDDDARSPTVIASIEETIYNAIEFALHPTRRKMIWNGTPFHAGDPLYKAVESGSWEVNVYPVCEKFPCKPKEFKGSWEDRFTYESLKRTYEKMRGLGRLDSFEQELMLRIYSNEDRVIEDEDIQWYSRNDLLSLKENYNFYITTDFATSEKRSADYSVISVWAYNHQGYWFWVDGICKKQLMDKNLDDLFTLAQIYKPQGVGIEVTGQQGGFVSLIQREMIYRNIFFNLASSGNANKPGIRPNSQKFVRFMTIVPWFKSKMFFFPNELKETDIMLECMTELRLISKQGFKSKHDDFIDTISMLSMLTPWKPSETTEFTYNDTSGIWEEEEDYELKSNYDNYLCN